MALKATIYKADLQIADMDRNYYADHALTLARHPSETDERLMVRVLMYALHAQEGIAFTRGLSEADEPEIWVKDLTGQIKLWIDLGQPDEARLRKASGRAERVVAVCYGSSCGLWWKSLESKLTRLKNLSVLQLSVADSQALAALATRTMRLQCLVQDGEVWMSNEAARVPVTPTALKAPDS
ncbi:MAG: YaeQ family protein [Porticoccaceae bacterium]